MENSCKCRMCFHILLNALINISNFRRWKFVHLQETPRDKGYTVECGRQKQQYSPCQTQINKTNRETESGQLTNIF